MERRAIWAIAILLVGCPCAFALNPSLDINQYAHKPWTIRDGFFEGTIHSIAQTLDGYLWLGTDFGLQRFDGVRTVKWQPPAGEQLPSGLIFTLLTARDGSLWIGTGKGLARWGDGKLTQYPELAGQFVVALLEDREGTVWAGGVGSSTGKLCAILRGSAKCIGEDGRLGIGVISLYEDSRGNFWVGAQTGLWRWKPGPPKLYPMPGPVPEIRALIEGDNGALWIALRGGIKQLVDGKAEVYPLPGAGPQFSPSRLLRDRNGGLWIGTPHRGLLHVHQGRTDLFTQSDGLSANEVDSLFEDREGDIWVSTRGGLDRFREFAIPTISAKHGVSSASVWSVLAASDGSVWLGTSDGLNRWKDGKITIYGKRSGLPDDTADSLFQDDRGRIWVSTLRGIAYFENGRFTPVSGLPGGVVHSIAGDSAGNLWIGDQDQGLFHLSQGSGIERIPWTTLGRTDYAIALVADPLQSGLWLGFSKRGLAYFKDGQIRSSYSVSDGLGQGAVAGLQLDGKGALIAATEGGLSRVKNGRVATLSSKNGLPCDTVHWALEDNDQSVWLYTACGLVRIGRAELAAWFADSKRTIQPTVFDSSDGVTSSALPSGYTPHVAKSTDGKLWFVADDRVSVIDPRHLSLNKLPPPVHIEQIIADRKTYDASSNRRLPPLVRDLEIDYTALSLVAPEKIHFRYMLEGYDREWKEVINERKAFYTNLDPRHYRFRVIACNNSGVWNEAGDTLDFSIDPAYYQTTWFKATCLAVFLLALWGVHQLRLHQIAREFNAQLDGRVDERTRIAGELHDTLLQSFQGLMLSFQTVRNLLPARPAEAAKLMDGALDQADRAIVEGREAIQDMRASTVITNDLAQALTALGDELASNDSLEGAPEFQVVVEGASQELHPILRDDIYRLTREAIRNAFRHSHARRIEAEITYSESSLRVRIRDDGIGIDPAVVKEGRSGHYGLPGMRERAAIIGGQLNVWSGHGTGTEIELTVSGQIAYGTPPSGTTRAATVLTRFREYARRGPGKGDHAPR